MDLGLGRKESCFYWGWLNSSPSTAPVERLSLLANPSTFSFFCEETHVLSTPCPCSAHCCPSPYSPLSVPKLLSQYLSLSPFTSDHLCLPSGLLCCLFLFLSPLLIGCLCLSVSLSLSVCLSLSSCLRFSPFSLTRILPVCVSFTLILSVLLHLLSTFLLLFLPAHFIFCVHFPFLSAFVSDLSLFLK